VEFSITNVLRFSYFDHLKRDEGYAAIIETAHDKMVSSHQVKRFFSRFSFVCSRSFRWILKRLFLWRLLIEKPSLLIFTLDTQVLDNDDALKRQGVSVSYKKKKGFQPLHLLWNGKIIDALFRGGSTHGNNGQGAITMLTEMVRFIRKHYSQSVPIIIRLDSGFFDEKILRALDKLNVGFLCSGKLYQGVKDFMAACKGPWQIYDNGHQRWDYKEFGYRCQSWPCFFRALYTRLTHDGPQYLFDFARPDNVIVTNLGIKASLTKALTAAGYENLLLPEQLLANHHQRGADELPHRGLKDFASQKLPFHRILHLLLNCCLCHYHSNAKSGFKRFSANTAWYYCMIIAFFLFETFKEDNLEGLIEIGSYPTTVRRTIIDIAAKIVKTSGYIILKVSQAVMDRLNFDLLFEDCQTTPLRVSALLE